MMYSLKSSTAIITTRMWVAVVGMWIVGEGGI